VHGLLLGDERASMVITDPPYNVPISGHVSGGGATAHGEFIMASGEMTKEQFEAFLTASLGNLAAFSKAGALHYVFMDWRHMDEISTAARAVYGGLLNVCVWAKTNGGMGSLYRSAHELVFVYRVGKTGHLNNVQLGRFGRNRTNVWSYAGANSFGAERDGMLAMHPTVKPVGLVADAILDCTRRGDIVLDGFAGSGTTVMAAERVGRRARVVELDPKYADVVLRRWIATSGDQPILVDSGHNFDAVSEQRLG